MRPSPTHTDPSRLLPPAPHFCNIVPVAPPLYAACRDFPALFYQHQARPVATPSPLPQQVAGNPFLPPAPLPRLLALKSSQKPVLSWVERPPPHLVCTSSAGVDSLRGLLCSSRWPTWPFPRTLSPPRHPLACFSRGQFCNNVTTRHPPPTAAAIALVAPSHAASGWPCSLVAPCRSLLLCCAPLLLAHLQSAVSAHC